MDMEEYMRQNPDFAKKYAKPTQIKQVATQDKTVKSGTMFKLAIYAILTAFVSVVFWFIGMAGVASIGSVIPLVIFGGISAIFGIFSVAYVIATGVYIGVNS